MPDTGKLSAVEPKSIRPSERLVSRQMDNWLKMVYDYYAPEGAGNARSGETMSRVTNYLDTILQTVNRQIQGTSGLVSAPQEATSNVITATNTTMDAGHQDECQGCFEMVGGSGEGSRRYGIFKSCDHKFCEVCVRNLINNPSVGLTVMCPTCHVISDRVAFAETFPPNGPAKTALFSSMVCLGHHVDVDAQRRRLMNHRLGRRGPPGALRRLH